MQFNTMDCSSRSNNTERDSDLGEEMSHDDHSDDEVRDCDPAHRDHAITRSGRINVSSIAKSNGGGRAGDTNFNSSSRVGGGAEGDNSRVAGLRNSPEMLMSHRHQPQLPPTHPLNALGSFMGINSLHGLSNLQHTDVLEKLKMQVRDMKVGLMEQDYAAAAAHAHAAHAFGTNLLTTPNINPAFTLPPTSMPSFSSHTVQNMSTAASLQSTANNNSNGCSSGVGANIATNDGSMKNSTNDPTTTTAVGRGVGAATASSSSHQLTNGASGGSFSFTSPTTPNTREGNPASNSSTSSETSNSSQPNSGWSFEEQYKQVRQLYEINSDPKRKKFLDELFAFMQEKGTPITRLPVMAKSVLDLYELYKLVVARGGLVEVINKKLWQEIIKGLHMPQSITSAAFTLRTQYMKYIYSFECHKHNFSTQEALDSAIDGNKREGRRSGYQMHMAQQTLSANPLGLVTNANHQQIAQVQAAQVQAQVQAQAQAAQRMLTMGGHPHNVDYIKLLLANRNLAASYGGANNGSPMMDPLIDDARREFLENILMYVQQHNSVSPPLGLFSMLQRQHSRSPPQGTAIRTPPTSTAVSGALNGTANAMLNGTLNNGFAESHGHEPYSDSSSEALNLANSTLNLPTAQKRAHGDEPSTSAATPEDLHTTPLKRLNNGQLWQTGIYNLQQNINNNNIVTKNMNSTHESNGERGNDSNDEGDENNEGNHYHGSYVPMMRQYNDFGGLHPLQQQQQQLAQQQMVQQELEAQQLDQEELEQQQASPQHTNEAAPDQPHHPLQAPEPGSKLARHRKSDSALEDSPASAGNVSPVTSAPKNDNDNTPCRCATACVCKETVAPEMAIFTAAMAIVQKGAGQSGCRFIEAIFGKCRTKNRRPRIRRAIKEIPDNGNDTKTLLPPPPPPPAVLTPPVAPTISAIYHITETTSGEELSPLVVQRATLVENHKDNDCIDIKPIISTAVIQTCTPTIKMPSTQSPEMSSTSTSVEQ